MYAGYKISYLEEFIARFVLPPYVVLLAFFHFMIRSLGNFYTEKTDLIESKKIICLNDFL